MGGELYVDKLLAANIAVYKQPFENQKMRLMPVSGVDGQGALHRTGPSERRRRGRRRKHGDIDGRGDGDSCHWRRRRRRGGRSAHSGADANRRTLASVANARRQACRIRSAHTLLRAQSYSALNRGIRQLPAFVVLRTHPKFAGCDRGSAEGKLGSAGVCSRN